jgi:hypothetical protein
MAASAMPRVDLALVQRQAMPEEEEKLQSRLQRQAAPEE